MSAALIYAKSLVEFDCALLGYIEGGGMMIRGTKAAMRLHRSGFEVYGEITGYTDAFQPPPAKLRRRLCGMAPSTPGEFPGVRAHAGDAERSGGGGVSAAHAGHIANLAMRGAGFG